MKKKYCKFLIAAVALLLSAATLLSGCGPTSSEEELNGMQQADKLGQNYGDDDSVTNQGENAPVVTLKPGERPYRSKGKWTSVADSNVVYDLKVTTFNVGNWYHGVTNLNIYGAQETVHPGITPERVLNAYNQWMQAFPEYDTDVLCIWNLTARRKSCRRWENEKSDQKEAKNGLLLQIRRNVLFPPAVADAVSVLRRHPDFVRDCDELHGFRHGAYAALCRLPQLSLAAAG